MFHKEHKCPQCDKIYKYAISLREHVRIAHEGGSNAYSCEQCGKTFDRESTLQIHIKGVHEKEKN